VCRLLEEPLVPSVHCDAWEICSPAPRSVTVVSMTRHTAATVLLILGVPELVVMQITGWSSTAMVARYQHVSGGILRDVAKEGADGTPGEPHDPVETVDETTDAEGPSRSIGSGRLAAEDTRFELVRGCPQHAFQKFVRASRSGRGRPDLRRSGSGGGIRMLLNGGE
jgi:stage III sporulation protein SpoIIIAA